ncbi:MAG: helix-turn-helix domain-containing protein [Nitriliruptor sp.]
MTGDGEVEDDARARAVGERLRDVRVQQDRSLQDVERLSEGELKASVVGAYERGERAVSLRRLQQLATFYRVPVIELLPPPARPPDAPDPSDLRLVIDLAELERHREAEPALARFVGSIRSRRGDLGRVLTVRAADLDTLAAVTASAPDQLRTRLTDAGILR